MSAAPQQWLIFANFFILLCLTPISAGPLRVRPGFVLLTLMLFSVLILEFSFHKAPWESCGVLAAFGLEVYWTIPKWEARHRRLP